MAPARIFGKEFSCPAINKELSIKPDAFEAPRETYELKSADPESPTYGAGGTTAVGSSTSVSQFVNENNKTEKNIYLNFIIICV
jgi:hypothetical protein